MRRLEPIKQKMQDLRYDLALADRELSVHWSRVHLRTVEWVVGASNAGATTYKSKIFHHMVLYIIHSCLWTRQSLNIYTQFCGLVSIYITRNVCGLVSLYITHSVSSVFMCWSQCLCIRHSVYVLVTVFVY